MMAPMNRKALASAHTREPMPTESWCKKGTGELTVGLRAWGEVSWGGWSRILPYQCEQVVS